MARTKEAGRKSKKANKNGGVNKAKAKTVKTNLKHLNIKNKAKTEEADEKFKALRHEIIGDAKELQKESSNLKVKEKEMPPPVNMEATTSEFEKLTSDSV